jgi:hypothetical protein
MSEFNELKAEYKALSGKNAPPMSADNLRAKIAELKEAAHPSVDAAAQTSAEGAPPSAGADPVPEAKIADSASPLPVDHDGSAAAEPQIDHGVSDHAEGDEDEASLEEQLAELGIEADADGNASIEMLTSLSGPEINLGPGDEHHCSAAEAVRMVRAGFAKARA